MIIFLECQLKKRVFYQSKYIFLNGDIMHCVLVDSYVNEGQWLSECRDSLAERKEEEKSIFEHVWAVLEGVIMYSGNDSEA